MMTQNEYNEWWFNHYSEMGVSGFPDPRDNDEDYYDIWVEQQQRYLEQRMNEHFDNLNERMYL